MEKDWKQKWLVNSGIVNANDLNRNKVIAINIIFHVKQRFTTYVSEHILKILEWFSNKNVYVVHKRHVEWI